MIRAGVIGHPVGHSLSPRIHNAWFEGLGIDGRYEAVDASPGAFKDTVRRLAGEGWRGLNVTIPHKEAALLIADEASAAARAIGAANLLIFDGERVAADNTDWLGFERALADIGLSASLGHAVVLGAGGAAAGVLHALGKSRRVTLLNRTRERAEALAARFGNIRTDDWSRRDEVANQGPQLLVNTTSLGMKGQPPLDLAFGRTPPGAVVDIVYQPPRTPLLRAAEEAGCRTQNGLPMLVHQAAPSFERFADASDMDVQETIRALEQEGA